MNKPVTKKDGLYKEALAWMSYRYAMGMTDYVSRKGYSELERYRQFMDIEFGSYEFRALVNAFCAFLKRKKIKDVITIKETYLEQDLIWLSKNYAMGRHSYAAAHWQDIVRYSQDVLTEAQKKHNALDIRREIAMHLQFQDFNFCIPHYLKEIHSPMDLFLTFITENSIETVEKLLQYDYFSEGKLKYKKVKRPLDKFRIEPWAAWSINEECIVEDNIENYNRKE